MSSLDPAAVTLFMIPGDTQTEAKSVTLDSYPGKFDMLILFDRTGSMTFAGSHGLGAVRGNILSIISDIQFYVPDSKFAFAFFKDYCNQTFPCVGVGCTNPGGAVFAGDAPEYSMTQDMTATGLNIFTAMTSSPAPSGGGDAAEAQNYVWNKAYTDTAISWRTDSRKFVMMASDSEPHGAGTDGITGCTDTSVDPHSMSAVTELAALNTNHRSLIMLLQDIVPTTTTTITAYHSLADLAYPGGDAFSIDNATIETDVVNTVLNAFGTIADVHLEFVSASPSPASSTWVTLPSPITSVTAPGTHSLGSVSITMPIGTPTNTYTIVLKAVADGVDIGEQTITISPPLPDPATLPGKLGYYKDSSWHLIEDYA